MSKICITREFVTQVFHDIIQRVAALVLTSGKEETNIISHSTQNLADVREVKHGIYTFYNPPAVSFVDMERSYSFIQNRSNHNRVILHKGLNLGIPQCGYR